MELSALLLSRLQFAFTVSFHIIFPSFTIGLAAWLTVLEALHLASGRPAFVSGEAVIGMVVYSAKAMLHGKGHDVWEMLIGNIP